jgi:hypothetical protein
MVADPVTCTAVMTVIASAAPAVMADPMNGPAVEVIRIATRGHSHSGGGHSHSGGGLS